MKKENNWLMDEILNLYPFEFDIFYNLCIKDLKDRIEAKEKSLNNG